MDGDQKELSTKRFCELEKWNAKANRAIGNKEEVKALLLQLNSSSPFDPDKK